MNVVTISVTAMLAAGIAAEIGLTKVSSAFIVISIILLFIAPICNGWLDE